MSEFNAYRYNSLGPEDEIRLIKLSSAKSKKDPLRCTIVLNRNFLRRDYFAISYAWGEPDFSRTLEIANYGGDISYLKITPNLDALLRCLRSLGVLDYLWVDAICLNQADEIEKARQIPKMGRIFGDAKDVHICLGPAEPQTVKLFNLFQQVSALSEIHGKRMVDRIFDLMITVFDHHPMGTIQCFRQFAERAWFSRRWVIQEALLARKALVHCGDCSIPLSVMTFAAARLQAISKLTSYPIKVMANLSSPANKPAMLELLWTFQEAHCLEPKDRVAALFGLSQDNYGYQLDYTADWTEMYKQIAFGVMRNGNNDAKLQLLLHLIEFGPVNPPPDTDYPPWIPDWSSGRRQGLPYHSLEGDIHASEPYPSSPGCSGQAILTLHHDLLQVTWNCSISGPQGWQAVYATMFDFDPWDKDDKYRKSLLELFPPASNSALAILAISILFEKVMHFRDPHNHYRSDSNRDDELYRSTILQQLPEKFHERMLETWRSHYLLRSFYVFKMKPMKPTHELDVGYGMTSQPIQSGDILIPLWKLEWDREAQKPQLDGHALYTTTMLVVRSIPVSSQDECVNTSNDEKPIIAGRLVGWAVCILLKYDSSINDFRTDAIWGTDIDRNQYSMTLL
ncbi:HET-domain-containing protein [Annulohypoxylon stygium]|nr:HET-domain-containing protein [Annulohypoxylon stygium]